MICPTCNAYLSNKAVKCLCGWVRTRADAPDPPSDLAQRLKAQEQARMDRANREASEFARASGLARRPDESFADWRKRCVKWFQDRSTERQRQRLYGQRQREPGDDDEELPA